MYTLSWLILAGDTKRRQNCQKHKKGSLFAVHRETWQVQRGQVGIEESVKWSGSTGWEEYENLIYLQGELYRLLKMSENS